MSPTSGTLVNRAGASELIEDMVSCQLIDLKMQPLVRIHGELQQETGTRLLLVLLNEWGDKTRLGGAVGDEVGDAVGDDV